MKSSVITCRKFGTKLCKIQIRNHLSSKSTLMQRLVQFLMMNCFCIVKQLEGGGVASGGLRELIPCIARTAVAVGVDGIFMEVWK